MRAARDTTARARVGGMQWPTVNMFSSEFEVKLEIGYTYNKVPIPHNAQNDSIFNANAYLAHAGARDIVLHQHDIEQCEREQRHPVESVAANALGAILKVADRGKQRDKNTSSPMQ